VPVSRQPPNLVDTLGLARILGTSRKAIARYVDQGLPVHVPAPYASERKFDTIAVIRWLIGRNRVDTPTGDVTHAEAARRLTTAKARRAELLLAEDEKELVRVDDVTQLFADKLVTFRAALYELPDRRAKELAISSDPSEISRILYAEIDVAMTTLMGADDD
jgi:phage terminase Nu1 subunit (DNA packaging protein)